MPDGSATSEPELQVLLARMRAGDREAAAEFMQRYGPRLRRRVSGKLSASMRRLFDSQEIMSTVARRLDRYVRSGRMGAASVPALWKLMTRITDRSLAEKARVFRALARKEGEDGAFAELVRIRLREAERTAPEGPEVELDLLLRRLSDPIDREILSLWFTGHDHVETSLVVGMSPEAVRKRWEKIRKHLREFLEGREHGQS